MLILYAVIAACFIGGAAFIYHGIGASAVAKHEQQVKVEQDKVTAVAKAKIDAEADWLINSQAAYEKGQAEAKVRTEIRYEKAKDYSAGQPVFQNRDCVVPAEGMAALNQARGQEAARILGLGDAPVSITEPKIVEPKRVPFPNPLDPPRTVTNPLLKKP